MKNSRKLLILVLALIAALALPNTALAAGQADQMHDEFVFGNTYTLESGETLDGNLYIFGGAAAIESGATVTGNIILVGGTLTVNGQVDGDIQITGGYLHLDDSAVVKGDINSAGGYINQEEGAVVEGAITRQTAGVPWTFQNFGDWRYLPMYRFMPLVNLSTFDLVWDGFLYLFTVFVMGFLAIVVVMFWPQHTARVAHSIVSQPLITGGLGLLTFLIAPPVLLVLALTILLSPLALIGFVLLVALTLFGWVALGFEIGQRAAAIFKVEWHPAVSAGLGTFALTLLVGGIYVVFNHLCCCLGWITALMVSSLGLGAALLSRFGTMDYPGPAAIGPAPVRPRPSVSPIPPVATSLPEAESAGVEPADAETSDAASPDTSSADEAEVA